MPGIITMSILNGYRILKSVEVSLMMNVDNINAQDEQLTSQTTVFRLLFQI